MNTTYSLSKEEVLERVKSRLEHFYIKIEEEINEDKIVWACIVMLGKNLIGFINCIHRTGIQDEWHALTVYDNGHVTSFVTIDFDEAIENLMS